MDRGFGSCGVWKLGTANCGLPCYPCFCGVDPSSPTTPNLFNSEHAGCHRPTRLPGFWRPNAQSQLLSIVIACGRHTTPPPQRQTFFTVACETALSPRSFKTT